MTAEKLAVGLVLVGGALACAGLALVYVPAALIAAGTGLVYVGAFADLERRDER